MNGFATRDDDSRRVSPTGDPASTETERWLLKSLVKMVGDPEIGVELWDGYRVGPASSAEAVRFNDRGALLRALYRPTYTFGVLFTAGRISVRGDLVRTMEEIYAGLARAEQRRSRTRRGLRRLTARRPVANSVAESKRNIHAHYDLGNPFYELWLDRDYTQYTCAYYERPELTLEQAQAAKLELVCRKLALRPGETVVEAGSGWGGLGRYLARHHGVKVRSYNISSEQVAYARQRARDEGLDHAVEYIEDDYRNIEGQYDVFVSVGMLEHVGPYNYGVMADTIDRCLTPDGRGLIHTIGQTQPRPMNEWIEGYIFPGAQPPSLGEMMAIFEPDRFLINDVENLRPHYARTLIHWRERFEASVEAVQHMFDVEFVRAWRLYLCGSIAAFTAGDLQLYQVVFSRHDCRALPETRAGLYAPGLAGPPAEPSPRG